MSVIEHNHTRTLEMSVCICVKLPHIYILITFLRRKIFFGNISCHFPVCCLFINHARSQATMCREPPFTAQPTATTTTSHLIISTSSLHIPFSLFASRRLRAYIYIQCIPSQPCDFFYTPPTFHNGVNFLGMMRVNVGYIFLCSRAFSFLSLYILYMHTQCRGFGWVSSLRCDVSVLYARAPHQINIYACRVNDAYSHGRIINPTHFQ